MNRKQQRRKIKKHLTLLVENVILIKSLRTEAEMIFEN
ncbi:hypothetical protein CHCC20327_0333 [Bacillus licheniformis]|nr:hypothetical protein CHCC20327_0333 [Bacillus licheniformis]